jgi:CRP-like cAMP-binding protein
MLGRSSFWRWRSRHDDGLVRALPSLGRSEIRALRQLTSLVGVPGGYRLAATGEFGAEVYLVVSGSVAVVREAQPIAVLGPGSIAGELGVALWSRRRVADLVALEPTCVAVASAGEWRMLLAITPRLAASVEQEADRRLLELAVLDL